MRPQGDNRPGAAVKQEYLDIIKQDYDIWFVVEDQPSLVEMWRSNGLCCLAMPATVDIIEKGAANVS
jgi:hypothetical protein